MEISSRTEDPFEVIALAGEVDLKSSPELREELLSRLKKGRDVLIDLSQVTYIDSSGIASLVEGYQVAKGQKQRFGLVGVSESARQVLQLARLDRVFDIRGTVADWSE